jgi:predicted HicB family RNase H-like nuclease
MFLWFHERQARDWAVEINGDSMDQETKIKQLTLRLPETLHKAFKLTAVRQGRTMGEVTIELIKQYIERTSDSL